VTKLAMDGDCVFGECEILTTPSGRILEEMVNNNVTLGISSRGMGSTTESVEIPGVLAVCEDYEMITFDMVSEPSTPEAYMSLAEAKRRYMSNAKSYGLNDSETRKALVEFVDALVKTNNK
jgi:galactose-1-phosphate uridylyltransferase